MFAGAKHVATPLPLTATFEHSVMPVVVSTNVTVPVLTVLLLVVVEVNVTAWFVKDGFKDEPTTVVVGNAAGVVTISSDHPPVTDEAPVPRLMLSAANRDHVPLTLAPLNPPKTLVIVPAPSGAAETYGGAGAGDGNVSTISA